MTTRFPSLLAIGLAYLMGVVSPAHAGGEVQNGGDAVFCEKSAVSPLTGYFSLDYLLTLQSSNSDLANVASWDQSKARIVGALRSKYPDLARLFEDFVARLPGDDAVGPDFKFIQRRIWSESVYGLSDLKDEKLIRKLPVNCYRKVSDGDVNILQAVIRQRRDQVTYYDYDPGILGELRVRAPLQYSFLVVHEWLWDFTSDVDVIRRVDRFLHSSVLERLGADELRLSLANLGLSLQFRDFVPVCDRSDKIRDGIELLVHKSCRDITQVSRSDLAPPGFGPSGLSLQQRGITVLLPGDFSGLGEVPWLFLGGNRISFLFEDVFFGAFGVEQLDLSDNLLTELQPGLFDFMPRLKKLDLRRNQLTSLSEKLFVAPSVSPMLSVDFSDNQIAEIPAGLITRFCKSPAFQRGLVFDGNRITKLPEHEIDACGGRTDTYSTGLTLTVQRNAFSESELARLRKKYMTPGNRLKMTLSL